MNVHISYAIRYRESKYKIKYYNPYLDLFNNQPAWTSTNRNEVRAFVRLLNLYYPTDYTNFEIFEITFKEEGVFKDDDKQS